MAILGAAAPETQQQTAPILIGVLGKQISWHADSSKSPHESAWVTITVACPWCGKAHGHGIRLGDISPSHRVSHCRSRPSKGYYVRPALWGEAGHDSHGHDPEKPVTRPRNGVAA
jgi:hypothetical protein